MPKDVVISSKVERPESQSTKPFKDFGTAPHLRLTTLILIESRNVVRECIARTLAQSSEFRVLSFPSVEKWIEAADDAVGSLIVWSSGGNGDRQQSELQFLAQRHNGIPIILLSDAEEPDQIINALDGGARGYIPTNVSLEVAIEAMRLVNAGGIYIPASSLLAAHQPSQERAAPKRLGMFTARQAAVVEALRKGKANKIIAYELNMRESTVKVHVRSIMKKLKARNRTEVAYLTSHFFNDQAKIANSFGESAS